MSQSIIELVDSLPQDNITVKILQALDFMIPGKWENLVGFDNSIQAITGASNPQNIGQIRDRAISLYNDKKNGYQTAIWLYQTADNADRAAAAAAIADKVGDTFRFIPFLDRLTPKADSIQSLDLKLKLVAELIAFSKISGANLNPVKFATAIKDSYRKEALLRMVALVCFDGVLPLGSNFVSYIKADLEKGKDLTNNPAFGTIDKFIPATDKQAFVNENFNAVGDWMDNLTQTFGLSKESVAQRLGGFIEIADDKLDYLAAFVDASTNFFEHTGIQTVARHLIDRASQEINN